VAQAERPPGQRRQAERRAQDLSAAFAHAAVNGEQCSRVQRGQTQE
jgi:hypothetical protein